MVPLYRRNFGRYRGVFPSLAIQQQARRSRTPMIQYLLALDGTRSASSSRARHQYRDSLRQRGQPGGMPSPWRIPFASTRPRAIYGPDEGGYWEFDVPTNGGTQAVWHPLERNPYFIATQADVGERRVRGQLLLQGMPYARADLYAETDARARSWGWPGTAEENPTVWAAMSPEAQAFGSWAGEDWVSWLGGLGLTGVSFGGPEMAVAQEILPDMPAAETVPQPALKSYP